MDKMDLITKVIPGLLVVGIVWFNMRKLQRNLNAISIAAALAIIAPIVPDALPHRKKIQIKKHKIL